MRRIKTIGGMTPLSDKDATLYIPDDHCFASMSPHVKNRAKTNKNDEWYTYYEDIGQEIPHYAPYLKGKRIICPADDPGQSMFYKYLKDNFSALGLKSVTATYYDPDRSIMTTYDGKTEVRRDLEGDGDILSDEIRGIINEHDVVITNPPFSLTRQWMGYLIPDGVRFLIVAPNDAICYSTVFPTSKTGEIRWGYNKIKSFKNTTKKLGMVGWITNLPVEDKPMLPLTERYTPDRYEKLIDPMGLGAIFIRKLKEIPADYPGYMAVPITLMEKINFNQFRIISIQHTCTLPSTPPGKHEFKRVIVVRV